MLLIPFFRLGSERVWRDEVSTGSGSDWVISGRSQKSHQLRTRSLPLPVLML